MTDLDKELEAIRLELDEHGRLEREAKAEREARRKRIEAAVDEGIATVFVTLIAFVFAPFIIFWECLREKTFETLVTLALILLAAFGWHRYRVNPAEAEYVYRSGFSMRPEEEIRCESVTRFEARCWSPAHGEMRCSATWEGARCAR